MASLIQQRAFQNVIDGAPSIGKAMRDAGYSEITANTPKNLTNSKGWAELCDKYLPDKKLIQVNREGLGAVNERNQPDYAIRHKYLETALKLKGKFIERQEIHGSFIINMDELIGLSDITAEAEDGDTNPVEA